MTTLENLVKNTKESDIDRQGGELFINIEGKDAVTLSELKDLEGLDIPYPYAEVTLKKVNQVSTCIYENVDGRFLSLLVTATFNLQYHDGTKMETMEDEFTIWIPEEDGGAIEGNDFGSLKVVHDVQVEPEMLESVLSRFNI